MTVRQRSLTVISASFFGWSLLRSLQDILVIADQVHSDLITKPERCNLDAGIGSSKLPMNKLK